MSSSLIRLSVSLGVFALALLGYYLGYGMVANQSAEAADLSNQIDSKTAVEARAAAARAALGELANDEAQVEQYFVSNDNVVAFLGDLESRGTKQGATVKVSSVSSGSTGGHTALSISLSISGSFGSVMNTIGSIEYAPYDLSVTALTLNTGGSTDTTDATKKGAPGTQWTAALTISVGSAPGSIGTSTPTSIPNVLTQPVKTTSTNGSPAVQPL